MRTPFLTQIGTYLITLRVEIVVTNDDDLETLISCHFERLVANFFNGEEKHAFQRELHEFVLPLTAQQRTREKEGKEKGRKGGGRREEIVVSGTPGSRKPHRQD